MLINYQTTQGESTEIADFVWRFCANYIVLNAVTKLIALSIECYYEAVTMDFEDSRWKWLTIDISSYNQIKVPRSSWPKFALLNP